MKYYFYYKKRIEFFTFTLLTLLCIGASLLLVGLVNVQDPDAHMSKKIMEFLFSFGFMSSCFFHEYKSEGLFKRIHEDMATQMSRHREWKETQSSNKKENAVESNNKKNK